MKTNDNLIPIATSITCLMLLFTAFVLNQAQAANYDDQYQRWREKQLLTAQPSGIDRQQNNADQPASRAASSATNATAANKVSINQANVEQLQQLKGVGGKKAQDIIEFRLKNGPFKSIEELQNVKGIGPKLLEKNRDRLSL